MTQLMLALALGGPPHSPDQLELQLQELWSVQGVCSLAQFALPDRRSQFRALDLCESAVGVGVRSGRSPDALLRFNAVRRAHRISVSGTSRLEDVRKPARATRQLTAFALEYDIDTFADELPTITSEGLIMANVLIPVVERRGVWYVDVVNGRLRDRSPK